MAEPLLESVGNKFSQDLLQSARDRTLKVIEVSSKLILPGMRESEARALVRRVQKERGSPKAWHPPQVRFGKNTLLSFGAKGEADPILKNNDIYFLDLGPLFEGHEGDVGRSFAVGDDSEMLRCSRDVEKIWKEVRKEWQRSGASGKDLYLFAAQSAEQKGWKLILKGANGHRISDFPHIVGHRGSIVGLAQKPKADRWILEIQIRHPTRSFGAFFEDLLH